MTEKSKTPASESLKPRDARRTWARPVLTHYGPIGKLTQGNSGTMNDGTSGKKSCL